MTDEEDLGRRLYRTLEAHERELKNALESLGRVQSSVRSAADEEAVPREELVAIGKRLEHHEDALRVVVETLDEHKRVIRDTENTDETALAEAMERARQRARQEGHPPDPTADRNP